VRISHLLAHATSGIQAKTTYGAFSHNHKHQTNILSTIHDQKHARHLKSFKTLASYEGKKALGGMKTTTLQ